MGLKHFLRPTAQLKAAKSAYGQCEETYNNYKVVRQEVFEKFKKVSLIQEDGVSSQAVQEPDEKYQEIKNKWTRLENDWEQISRQNATLEALTDKVERNKHGFRTISDASWDNIRLNLQGKIAHQQSAIKQCNDHIYNLTQGSGPEVSRSLRVIGQTIQEKIDIQYRERQRYQERLDSLLELNQEFEQDPDMVWIRFRHIVEKAIGALKALEVLIDDYHNPDDEELQVRKQNLLEQLEQNTYGAREVFEETEL